jgi:hypothetical protein
MYLHSFPRISGTQSGITPSGAGAPGPVLSLSKGSDDVGAKPISFEVVPDPLDGLRKTVLQGVLRIPSKDLVSFAIVSAELRHLTMVGPDPLIITADRHIRPAYQVQDKGGQVADRNLPPGADIDDLTNGVWALGGPNEPLYRIHHIIEVSGRFKAAQMDCRLS